MLFSSLSLMERYVEAVVMVLSVGSVILVILFDIGVAFCVEECLYVDCGYSGLQVLIDSMRGVVYTMISL